MKHFLISLLLVAGVATVFAQVKTVKPTVAPTVMIGQDTSAVISAYKVWNDANPQEQWNRFSYPDRLVYYCEVATNQNKSNVAHIYEFDENGVCSKYITVASNEKLDYAVNYMNTVSLRNKNVWNFLGKTEENQGEWISSKYVTNFTGCNCGNIKVTIKGNLPTDEIQEWFKYCPVKPDEAGNLMMMEYMAYNQ